MFLYNFFDYKDDIPNFQSDIYSRNHIIFLILALISLIFVYIFSKKLSHKKVDLFFKILFITATSLEVVKVIWESTYDIGRGKGFNIIGILPIYTCSLLMYCSFCVAFLKGKAKDIGLSWICTIGMMTGLIVLFYPNGLNYYPVLTFGGLHTLLFHYSIVLAAVISISSSYIKLEWKSVLKGMIPMFILALVVIPVNYIYKSDYMQIYRGEGVPLLSNLASYLAQKNLRFIFTIIMMLLYYPLASIPVLISKIVNAIRNNKKKEFN